MKPLILIAEDAKGQAAILGMMLDNYDTVIVHSLDAARSVLEAVQFAAIILDLNLPDSKGIDTFDEVLAVTKAPVVVTTGLDCDEIRKTVEAAGETFLQKPYTIGGLQAAVTEALRRE